MYKTLYKILTGADANTEKLCHYHLRLIGKRVVDFLLVLIKLFRYVLRLKRYERISVQNQQFCPNGSRLTQNFR